jgi:hypothetical protein
MSDYLDPMFPDEDHLRKWPSDAYPDSPPEGRRGRRRSVLLAGVRPSVVWIGLAIGLVIGALILLFSCSPGPVQNQRTAAERKAREMKLLHDQHAGFAQVERDFNKRQMQHPKE